MNPLLINAAELLRRPGSERRFNLEPTIADLGIADPRFEGIVSQFDGGRNAVKREASDEQSRRRY